MSNPILDSLLDHLGTQGLTPILLQQLTEQDLTSIPGPEGNPLTSIQLLVLKAYIRSLKSASRSGHSKSTASKTRIEELKEENSRLRVLAMPNAAAMEERDQLKQDMENQKKRISEFVTSSIQKTSMSLNQLREMIAELETLGACLDICFCMDGTGSMRSCISKVKESIIKVSADITCSTGMETRFALVVYRDYCDSSKRLQVWDFASSAQIQSHLSEVAANGGGDGCEDCFGGLWATVTRVAWKGPARIIIWMGDAPQHGSQYSGGVDDDHPEGDPDGITSAKIFAELRRLGAMLVFCRLNRSTDEMIAQLKIETIPYGAGLLRDFDVATDMTSFLTSTIEATSSQTMVRGKPAKARIKPYRIVAATWTINELWGTEEAAEVLTFTGFKGSELPPLLDLIKDGPDIKKRSVSCRMTLSPVAQGEMRFAYYAKIIEPGILWNSKKMGVTKESRFEGAHNSKKTLINQAIIQAVATLLANDFSLKLKRLNINKKIVYVPVELLRISRSTSGKKYYALEPFIQGDYLKFNNNNGNVDKILEASHPLLQTFSHFTHTISNGLVMVVDIQGVIKSNEYTLTDPAIHTSDRLLFLPDKTNLGTKGMAAFFSSHQCNKFCRKMNLKRVDEIDVNAPMDVSDSGAATEAMFNPVQAYPVFVE